MVRLLILYTLKNLPKLNNLTIYSIQTLFGGTYRFTRQCVDINIPEVSHQLNVLNNASYCVENTCWNTTLHPFCVCGEEQYNDTETGCKHISGDGISEDIKHHYLPEDYGVFDGSFSNILIGSVRLMVHISTENYPDFIREFSDVKVEQ